MYKKFLDLRRTHDGHLISRAVRQDAVVIFGVDTALDAALHGEALAGAHVRRLSRHRAPGDARQVVRPSVPAVHCQDDVTDLTAQRRTPQRGCPAQYAGQLDLVEGALAAQSQLVGEHGDHQPAALAAFVVEGPQLTDDGNGGPSRHRYSMEQRLGHDDRQAVCLPRQAHHRQRKPVEGAAVVDVGQSGHVLRLPA